MTDESPGNSDVPGPEPKRKPKGKREGGGGRIMKRPRKRPLGLASLTKATRLAPKHNRSKARAAPVAAFLPRKIAARHLSVAPPTNPYPWQPRKPRLGLHAPGPGKPRHGAAVCLHSKRMIPRAPPPNAPVKPMTGTGHAFSTRSALYRWHKANGTLDEYFRMFGIDPY